VIHALLYLWFAWQIASPQAAEHMQAGIAADKQKHFDVAITEYKKVTELDPSFADGFISLGQAYMENGDYASAIPPLKRALELSADSLPAHQLLGYALLSQGYASQAIPHLQRSPDKTALGIAQTQTGQFPEAVANLQKSLAAHPNDPDILYYLGRASGLRVLKRGLCLLRVASEHDRVARRKRIRPDRVDTDDALIRQTVDRLFGIRRFDEPVHRLTRRPNFPVERISHLQHLR